MMSSASTGLLVRLGAFSAAGVPLKTSALRIPPSSDDMDQSHSLF